MRRHAPIAAALAAYLVALPAAAQQEQQRPDHAAALARFAEQASGLFRAWPDEGAGASVYAIEPRAPRLPVRLTVSAADDRNLDGRCALDQDVLQVALENALGDAGLTLAGEAEPDAIEVLLTATTADQAGERCVDLVSGEARLSRRVAVVGDATYVFEPVLYAESALVPHRPRDFPTREIEGLLDRLVGGIEAVLDDPPP